MINKEDFLFDLVKQLNIELSEDQIKKLNRYYELLVEWNEKINLTAITEYKDVCIKHFADSFSVVKLFSSYDEARKVFSGKTLIDVGTGAGFPGVCLKIIFPELIITLADSLDKRIKFLNEVISELGLSGIKAVHSRVEDLARNKDYREKYDYSTARAVASLPVLSEYCIPFVKRDGYFIAYKSEKSEEEILLSSNALKLLGGNIEKTEVFILPESDSQRNLILIKKTKDTPSQYPRKAGTPTKKPL